MAGPRTLVILGVTRTDTGPPFFRMLREAELIDAENRVCAPRLSGALRDLLASDPGSGLDLIPGGG